MGREFPLQCTLLKISKSSRSGKMKRKSYQNVLMVSFDRILDVIHDEVAGL
jgi:hypothetical protein